MKSNELRLGNYVYIDNPEIYPELKNVPFRVGGIHFDEYEKEEIINFTGEEVINFADEFSQYFKYIVPIPLTEEWLLKFGFKKNKSMFLYLNDFGIHFEFDAFSYQTCLWQSDSIKYVHQLQNLYFALTGEELEYGI